jgi:hypothetical protein
MPTVEARMQGINRGSAGKSPIAADSPINLGWMLSVPTLLCRCRKSAVAQRR